MLDVRRYDGASRVVSSGPGTLDPAYLSALVGSGLDSASAAATVTRYDNAGRILHQHVTNEADNSASYDVDYENTTRWTTEESVISSSRTSMNRAMP